MPATTSTLPALDGMRRRSQPASATVPGGAYPEAAPVAGAGAPSRPQPAEAERATAAERPEAREDREGQAQGQARNFARETARIRSVARQAGQQQVKAAAGKAVAGAAKKAVVRAVWRGIIYIAGLVAPYVGIALLIVLGVVLLYLMARYTYDNNLVGKTLNFFGVDFDAVVKGFASFF